MKNDVALGNSEPIALQHLYRAMDVLLEHKDLIHKEVFSVADMHELRGEPENPPDGRRSLHPWREALG